MTNTPAWNLTLLEQPQHAVLDHARDRTIPSGMRWRLVEAILRCLSIHLRRKNGVPLRDDFYVETVPEMGLPEDTCLLARRGWYGMRDAGQAFEFAIRDHFLDHDFTQGMFSTFVFAHRSKFLLYFVHGDDYVGPGVRGDLEGSKRNCLNGSS